MKKTPATYARELHNALLSAGEGESRRAIRGMLNELARTRRTNLRPRIVSMFSELALAAEGYRPGILTTAKEIDSATRSKMKKAFKNVVFDERVDPTLLGGAIVEVDGIRTDGSVRAKLDALKRAITNNNG
jgi:F0F1-type ATP synthase delta subunit